MNCNVAAMLRATIYHSWLPPAELRLNRASGETRECSAYFCSVADEALNDAANRSDTRSRRARPWKGACSAAFKGNARTKEWGDGAGHLSANTLSGWREHPVQVAVKRHVLRAALGSAASNAVATSLAWLLRLHSDPKSIADRVHGTVAAHEHS